jgi:hypothetical protein
VAAGLKKMTSVRSASALATFICNIYLCPLLCCSLGSASALVTLICVLCTLRISRSICNFTHFRVHWAPPSSASDSVPAR